jgi:peptidoglycan/LPS O-acetylase OafA/YrhL
MSSPTPTAVRAGVRTDIQGLRAIAVGIVLVYHVWPGAVRGGFVGVDAFFVISGFLITSHLLANPPRTPRDLVGFWSRRIRRLLPASLLVLGATLVASRMVAPETQWGNTASQARAAALYVVNWVLAKDSVDYLAAENAASPVQHFWSLSVEEQFYVVWPLLILLLALFAGSSARRRGLVFGLGLGAAVLASFVYSVTETASDPAAAYFVTPTRIWELGVGGLLALVSAPRVLGRPGPRTPSRWPARLLGWGGLAAIAVSAGVYSGSTPFPGWQALVPTLGTAAVIAAGSTTDRGSPGPALALRPVQWLGDVSYSLYLWHWPLVVLAPDVLGRLGTLDRVSIVLASLGLAGLTKVLVEDRFRSAAWGFPLRKPYVFAAVAMALVVVGAATQVDEVQVRQKEARIALAKAVKQGGSCFGASALDRGSSCPTTPYADLLPAPVDAATDKSQAYADVPGGDDCFANAPSFPQRLCTFGDPASTTRIALVGNSHAGQWLPALAELARTNGWRIDTFLASRCASAETPQEFDTAAQTRSCTTWVDDTVAAVVKDAPDLVVMTNRTSSAAVGHSLADSRPAYENGYAAVLSTFRDAGLKVLALHDTPAPGEQVPDCVASNLDHYTRCDGARKDWVPMDPTSTAVHRVDDPGIRFTDLTDHICGPRTCHVVTGGLITYFDGSHLTATFATTLAPYLGRPMKALLDQ